MNSKIIPARKKKRSVRLSDVAKLVGVSTATVSRALALPETVNEETRKTILEAVRQTGYTPNVAARNLRVQRTNMVLVVVSQIANTSFAENLSGIDEELTQHGYGFIIGHLDDHAEREGRFIRLAMSGAVDGLLLLSLSRLPHDDHQTIISAGLPAVVLNEKLEGANLPLVCVDNFEASVAVVEHLYGLGHRRMAFIAGPRGGYTALERQRGFIAGLIKCGLETSNATIWPGEYHFRDGIAAGVQFLAMPERPTAVYAANDEMAIGFMKQMHESGVSVPDDVSVIGFDGVDYANYVVPTLTTVLQPRRELGRRAARTLLSQIRGEAVAADLKLPTSLTLRRSTGPAINRPQ